MRLILIIAIVAGLANACSCLPPGTPLEELNKSDAVFSGKAASIAQDGYGYIVTFEAERAWKGVDAPVVKVRTAQDSAACGYAFTTGEKYLVYAYKGDDGSLSTGLCSRTAPLSDAASDVAAIGSGTAITPPKEGMDAGTFAALGLIVLGLALFAYFLFRKMRA